MKRIWGKRQRFSLNFETYWKNAVPFPALSTGSVYINKHGQSFWIFPSQSWALSTAIRLEASPLSVDHPAMEWILDFTFSRIPSEIDMAPAVTYKKYI